jgi:predicted phage baseplate assembly protein
MPLIPPRLDDRSFDGLVAELLARIPAHTPEWTNPRVGDPGRTLIELFAWLADTILYRANLVPERQRLVFLKLLGIQLRPALPARGIVTVAFADEAERVPRTLRVGARVQGPPTFETQGELTVLPLAAQVFVKRKLDEGQKAELLPVIRELTGLYRALASTRDDAADPSPYTATPLFTSSPPPAAGFDFVASTVDQALWYALLAASPEAVAPLRTALREGQEGRPFRLNVGVVPTTAPIEAGGELPRRRPIAHVWEITTAETQAGLPVFRGLDVTADSSGGLTRNGVVQLALSVGSLGAPTNDPRQDPLAGVRDQSPPRIDDPAVAARIVAWLRLRPVERLNSLGLTWTGINAVEVVGSRTFRGLVVGQGDGTAQQTLQLPALAIDPTSLVLHVEEGERGYQPWQLVEDTSAFGRDARVYTLDAEAGTVRFGDGVRGRLPDAGARVRVFEMRAGGGVEGNLPSGTLKSISAEAPSGAPIAATFTIAQPLATRGGVAAETLAEAEARIPAVLRHRNRAVTKDDYVALAASTPGLRVGRVEVLPRFKPQQRRSDVVGALTVMVVPASSSSDAQPPAPRADRPFLEAVHGWLDERRTIGTELYVVGTEYVPIGVSVGVDVREGFAQEETLSAVRLSLRAFLWPLAPGGARGSGWDLGATVLAGQLEVAVARVPGVSLVRGVRVFERAGSEWQPAAMLGAGSQGVRLERWQLPELLSVVAVIGAEPPQDLRGVPSPFRGEGSGSGISIPVVPEVC